MIDVIREDQKMNIRELELLAVIEQMREAMEEVLRISDRKHDVWDAAKEALALTPDLSALDAYFKRRFDEVMAAAYPKGKP